jgi:hypothetical protein
MNPLNALRDAGVSVTTHPTIFAKAITSWEAYAGQIRSGACLSGGPLPDYGRSGPWRGNR